MKLIQNRWTSTWPILACVHHAAAAHPMDISIMVRLSPEEVEAIKLSVYRLDPNAKIFIFGSRADPNKKGGDIDLLVISEILTNESKLDIKHLLFKSIEEQKVDIIIAKDETDPFVKIALSEGKQL